MFHFSRRRAAVVTLTGLSGITGAVSYEHGRAVVLATGSTGIVSWLIPAIPDLLLINGSLTMLEASAMGVERPWTAKGAVAVGIGWTIAANVVAGLHGGWGGALIAGGIPVAFLLALECLMWMARRGRKAAADMADTEEDMADIRQDAPHAEPANGNAAEARRLHAENPGMTQAEIAEKLAVSTRTVRRYLEGAQA